MKPVRALPRVLASWRDVPWAPIPNDVQFLLSDTLPPRERITTAFVFAFRGEALLLAHLADRGWEVPGGHLHAGESPEAALRRETYEETAARLDAVSLIGYQTIRVQAAMPAQYRYPYPDSYQVYYRARVVALDPFTGDSEAINRDLFPPERAVTVPWVQDNRALYDVVLGLLHGGSEG